MKRWLRRLFNRTHRNKYAVLSALGMAADGVQQVMPYLPDSMPRAAVLGLTLFVVAGGIISHFVQPEAPSA